MANSTLNLSVTSHGFVQLHFVSYRNKYAIKNIWPKHTSRPHHLMWAVNVPYTLKRFPHWRHEMLLNIWNTLVGLSSPLSFLLDHFNTGKGTYTYTSSSTKHSVCTGVILNTYSLIIICWLHIHWNKGAAHSDILLSVATYKFSYLLNMHLSRLSDKLTGYKNQILLLLSTSIYDTKYMWQLAFCTIFI